MSKTDEKIMKVLEIIQDRRMDLIKQLRQMEKLERDKLEMEHNPLIFSPYLTPEIGMLRNIISYLGQFQYEIEKILEK